MLNLKRLQYLDAVYQCRNFTQASELLYVSQPAISSAIQALEAAGTAAELERALEAAYQEGVESNG